MMGRLLQVSKTGQQILNDIAPTRMRIAMEAKLNSERLRLRANALRDTALQQIEHSPGLADILFTMWRETCVQVSKEHSVYMEMRV